jgi:hypothetical protein
VQTYKKASVNAFRVGVRCHVQGLLGQGVAAVAVCKAAKREDKAEAAWHADPSTKSAAVPAKRKAKRKAVELHVDLHACARRPLDLHAQQLVPTRPTELTTTSRC